LNKWKSVALTKLKIGVYIPMPATAAMIISIRTVDDLIGDKSINGGFGAWIWVFFSFTCIPDDRGDKMESLLFESFQWRVGFLLADIPSK
jgi:hypothetical protein